MRRIVPLAPLVAVVLLALLPAGAARADDEAPRSNQFSIDLDAASAGVTYASRIGQSRVLLGGGGGLGFSPLLGKTIATGTHYDEPDVLQVFEVVNLQFFARLELVSWLRVDTGVRAGAFIHLPRNPEAASSRRCSWRRRSPGGGCGSGRASRRAC